MDYSHLRSTAQGLLLCNATHFDLAQTLDCGQSFRWQPCGNDTNVYDGFAANRHLRIRRIGNDLLFEKTTLQEFEAFWKNYFDLERDYSELQHQLRQDETLRRAVAFAPGIRVLRQDPWEALCSFILSQNNNVMRIKGIVARLCASFGSPVEGGYTFPSPDRLAACDLDALASVRCGFRAKYILDAARKVSSGALQLQPLYTLPIDAARAQLTGIYGVGPKVANCVLLYGFGRAECVPVDIWMSRALAQWYPNGLPKTLAPVAGIAQQYLFHYARCCPDAVEKKTALPEK
jgi:3-methyladenine DNA glycosylase/8-oxoguanine DNA glycosylase